MMAKKTNRSSGGGMEAPPPKDTRRAHGDLTPIHVANQVVTRTHLVRVRFAGMSAHARTTLDELDDDADLRASTNFRRPGVDGIGDGNDGGFKASSTLIFRLGARSPAPDDDNESETCVVVKATLEVSYGFNDDSPDFTEEQLRTFALHYWPFHVWGYWREFVHSSLARLEFPALTVPLFQIEMAPALVVDEVD